MATWHARLRQDTERAIVLSHSSGSVGKYCSVQCAIKHAEQQVDQLLHYSNYLTRRTNRYYKEIQSSKARHKKYSEKQIDARFCAKSNTSTPNNPYRTWSTRGSQTLPTDFLGHLWHTMALNFRNASTISAGFTLCQYTSFTNGIPFLPPPPSQPQTATPQLHRHILTNQLFLPFNQATLISNLQHQYHVLVQHQPQPAYSTSAPHQKRFDSPTMQQKPAEPSIIKV